MFASIFTFTIIFSPIGYPGFWPEPENWQERINHEYAVVFSRSKVLKKPGTAPTTAGA